MTEEVVRERLDERAPCGPMCVVRVVALGAATVFVAGPPPTAFVLQSESGVALTLAAAVQIGLLWGVGDECLCAWGEREGERASSARLLTPTLEWYQDLSPNAASRASAIASS